MPELQDFSAAIGFCPGMHCLRASAMLQVVARGANVCVITRNMPFSHGAVHKTFRRRISPQIEDPWPLTQVTQTGIRQISQSQIQPSRRVPNTDLLNTRAEMNLNLHTRQRVYRFEQESSSFSATVVLTQDHCISLDLTKSA
jgi:hypothetical protein